MHFTRVLVVEMRFLEGIGSLFSRGGIGHLLKGIPGRDSAQSALHVRVDDLEAVDIGRVDPAETITELAMYVNNFNGETYPSVATPLKSEP
jgi:hypothetical protein